MLRSAGKNIFGRFRDVPGRVLSWILCLCLIFQTVGVSQAATGASVEQKKQEMNATALSEDVEISPEISVLVAGIDNDLLRRVKVSPETVGGNEVEVQVSSVERLKHDGSVDDTFVWSASGAGSLLTPNDSDSENGMFYRITYSAVCDGVNVSSTTVECPVVKITDNGGRLIDVADNEKTDNMIQTVLMVNGASAHTVDKESSDYSITEPVLQSGTEIFVRIKNIHILDDKIDDGTVVDGKVFSFDVPSAFVPVDDKGNLMLDGKWVYLDQLVGKTEAWGRIFENKFQIFFVNTEGQSNITAAYQYTAKIDDSYSNKEKVDGEFSNGDYYSIPLKQPEKPAIVTKTANWLSSDKELLGSNVGPYDHSRQILYTLTVTNPNPGSPFSLDLTEYLNSDNSTGFVPAEGVSFTDNLAIVYKNASTVTMDYYSAGIPDITVKEGGELKSLISQGSLGFKGGSVTVSFDSLNNRMNGKNLTYSVFDEMHISIQNTAADTVEISYVVETYSNSVNIKASGDSLRKYVSVTSYIEDGDKKQCVASAEKSLTRPSVAIQHMPNSDVAKWLTGEKTSKYSPSNPYDYASGTQKYTVNLNSGGENWVRITEKGYFQQYMSLWGESSDNYSSRLTSNFFLRNNLFNFAFSPSYSGTDNSYDPLFRNNNIKGEFSLSVDGFNFADSSNYSDFGIYSGGTSLPYNVMLQKASEADPIVAMEIDALYSANKNAVGDWRWSDAGYALYVQKQPSAEGKAPKILLVVPRTINAYNKTVSTGDPTKIPACNESGEAVGFELYVFNTDPESNSESPNVTIEYNKYLYNISNGLANGTGAPGEPYWLNDFSMAVAENSFNYNKDEVRQNITFAQNDYVEKKGFLQEDGSIRWELTVDLKYFDNWYKKYLQFGDYNGLANGMPAVMVVNDLIPEGYKLSSDSKLYLASGLISQIQSGTFGVDYYSCDYFFLKNMKERVIPAPLSYYVKEFMYSNYKQFAGENFNYQASQSSYSQKAISFELNYTMLDSLFSGNDTDSKIQIVYITVPENYKNSRSVGYYLEENKAEVQLFMYYMKQPVVSSPLISGGAIIPGVDSKNVKSKGSLITSEIVSNLATGLNGRGVYFSGVYSISDSMKNTVASSDKQVIEDKDQIAAQYISLQDMTVKITPAQGSAQIVTITSEQINTAVAATDHSVTVPASGGGYVKLKFNFKTASGLNVNNMYDGFTLTVYGFEKGSPYYNLSNITTTYNCVFDAAAFSSAINAKGMLSFKLANGAYRNYRGIDNRGGEKSGTSSSFRYAANPHLSKEWVSSDKKDASNRGVYKNSYKVVADVGPTAQDSVYLVDQVNRILQYKKYVSDLDAPADKELRIDDETASELADFMKYFHVENLKVMVGENRLTMNEGDPEEVQIIWQEMPDGTYKSMSEDYEVTVVNKSQLESVVVPEKNESDQYFDLAGNLYSFMVKRTDGAKLSNETYFIITYDLIIGEDSDGNSFRSDSNYLGGSLALDTQAAIAYPSDVHAAAVNLPKVNVYTLSEIENHVPATLAIRSSLASVGNRSAFGNGGVSTIAAGGWDSAGGGVVGTQFLGFMEGVKAHNADGYYTATINTGSAYKEGDENSASIDISDVLYISPLLNKKHIEDDELNEKLAVLFFKYMTFEFGGIYYYNEDDEKISLYPDIAPDTVEFKNAELNFSDMSKVGEPDYIKGEDYHKNFVPDSKETYGASYKTLFQLKGSNLPYDTDIVVEYKIDFNFRKIIEEAVSMDLIKDTDKLVGGLLNSLEGVYPFAYDSYEFENPSELMGNLSKTGTVNKDGSVTWETTVSVDGTINEYTVTDMLRAGDEKGEANDLDKLAYSLTGFTDFEIWAADPSTLEASELIYKYDGDFVTGKAISFGDNELFSGAQLKFEDGTGFTLSFEKLNKSDLILRYTTAVNEDLFVQQGGSLNEGYKLYNVVTVLGPYGQLDSGNSQTVKKEDDASFEKQAVETDDSDRQKWVITANTGSYPAKSVVISDSISCANDDLLAYIQLSDIKVTVHNSDIGDVVIYSADSASKAVDLLSDYGGSWSKLSIGRNGETDFILGFETLDENTTVTVEYTTLADYDALKAAVEAGDISNVENIALENNAVFSRNNWVDRTASDEGDLFTGEPVVKEGSLKKTESSDEQPIVTWNAKIHLSAIASVQELKELSDVTITDTLPEGLLLYGSLSTVKLYSMRLNKGIYEKGTAIPSGEYTVAKAGNVLTVVLNNPADHPDVWLEFKTTAYTSLDSVTNTIEVDVNGKKASDTSEPVEDVYITTQSGSVFSVSRVKSRLEAYKNIDSEAIDNDKDLNGKFTFTAVEVDSDGKEIEDGYKSTATNDENGFVVFDETDYLKEGKHYYKVYEAEDVSDTDYSYDTAIYAVVIDVSLNMASAAYVITQTVYDFDEYMSDPLTAGSSDAVIFNNRTLHTLTVSKGVDGEAGETDVDFGFSVYLEDADGNPVSGEFPFAKGKGTPVLGTETIEFNASGKAEFSLKADESAVIYKLPDGYSYEVTETDADKNGYETEVPKSAEGTIDGKNAAAEFINSRDEGSLVITKTIESTTGVINRDKSFKFTLKFSDGYGEELTDADEVYTYVVTDSEGTVASGSVKSGGSIYLSHGQTAKINGLPNGTQCTVTEEETADDGYTARKAELSTEIHASNASGDRVDFINDYKADGKLSGSASLNIDKVLKGRKDNQWLETDEFEFVLSAKAGDSATVDGVADRTVVLPPSVVINSKTTDASGRHTAAFGDITFSKAGDYVFTVTEYRNGKPVDDKDRIDGITFAAPLEIKVTVTDTGTGELSAAVTNTTAAQDGSSAKPYVFTNTYTVDELEADITVSGTKTLTGDRTFMPGDEFTFTMTSLDGAPLPKTTSVTVKPETDSEGRVVNNSFTFGGENDKITYAAPGTYFYLIREEKPVKDLIPGMNYDSRIYVLTVSVTDNNDGTMTASQSLSVLPEAGGTAGNEADSADFTNTYNSKEALAEIDGIKALDGKELSAGEFGFVLEAEDGTPMPEGFTSKDGVARKDIVNGAGGIIHFGDIKFTVADAGVGKAAAKTYVYTVTEKQPTDDGTFEGKALDGAVLEDGRWVYRGVTYDSSVKTVSVSVWTEDIVDSNGIVTQTVFADVKGNEFAFRNSYSAEGTLEGETYLKVSKSLTGREWNENDEFAFVLAPYDADTESAVKDGSVVLPSNTEIKINFRTAALTEAFGNIKFYAEGKYRFRVSELNGGSRIDGVTYDGEAYVFTVTVTDEDFNGTFTVKAEGAEADGRFEFANTYTVDELEADISVSGSKVLKGREFKDGDKFYFAMTAKDGAPLPKKSLAILTPSPDGSGSLFCFGGKDDPIVFTEPGSYEYLIYELSSDMPGVANIEGVNYDAAVYRLTVNVKDNGDGTMSVESSKFEVSSDGSGEEWTSADASNADFTNTYFFDVDSVVIDALKALTGRQLNEGEFTFVLEAEEGVPMPEGSEKTADGLVGFEAHNLSDGGVLFDGIVFTPENAGASAEDAAVYTYTVREKQPTADGTFDGEALDGAVLVDGRWVYKGVTYDNSVYTVTVKVQTGEEIGDDGVKVQKTYVDMEDVEITFTNSYRATGTLNGSANLVVSKKLSGRQWNGNDKFLFVLEGGDDATLDAIEEGRIILPEITQLEITQLTEGYAAAFGDIVFNEEGLWNFVIYEIEGSEKGMTYDTKVRKIAVNVVDESFDGIYTVTVSGNSKEELAFTNVYADIKQDAPDVPDTPKTGDSSFPAAWAFLAVTSAICFAAACRKRKEEEA